MKNGSNKLRIIDLPEELLVYIARWINFEDVLAMAQTSKMIRNIMYDNTLWEEQYNSLFNKVPSEIPNLPSGLSDLPSGIQHPPEAIHYIAKFVSLYIHFKKKGIPSFNNSTYYTEALRNHTTFAFFAVKGYPQNFHSLSVHLKANKKIFEAAFIGLSHYYATEDRKSFFTNADKTLRNDEQFVFQLMGKTKCGFLYSEALIRVRSNPAVLKLAIQLGSRPFAKIPEKIKNDKTIMIDLVTFRGSLLQIASDALKADRELVLRALSQDPLALEHADQTLKADRGVVKYAVTRDGLALQHADQSLKADRSVVIHSIDQNPLALKYASLLLKNDYDIVKTAVEKNGMALEHSSPSLRANEDISLTAVRQNARALHYLHWNKDSYPSKKTALAGVTQNGETLTYVRVFRKDKDVVLAAVNQTFNALQYATNKEVLYKDPEIILTAIKTYKRDTNKNFLKCIIHPDSYYHSATCLLKNKDFLLKAIKLDERSFIYADDSLKNDRWFMLEAIKQNTKVLSYINKPFLNKEFLLDTIKKIPSALQCLDTEFKNNEQFVLAAVKGNGNSFRFADKKFQSDKEIALAALKQAPHVFRFISTELKNNEDFVLAAIKQAPDTFKFISPELKNNEDFVLTAVNNHGMVLRHVSKRFLSNKKIALAAINNNRKALQYVDAELKKDPAFKEYRMPSNREMASSSQQSRQNTTASANQTINAPGRYFTTTSSMFSPKTSSHHRFKRKRSPKTTSVPPVNSSEIPLCSTDTSTQSTINPGNSRRVSKHKKQRIKK